MSILEIHFMKCVRAAGLVAVLMVLVFGGATARAQNKIKVDGDYAGTLGPLHLKLFHPCMDTGRESLRMKKI
jgi:hypothetical protein